MTDSAKEEACSRCDGCGLIADSDEGEPWTAWRDLPPGSDLAVQMGLVKPIPCPKCCGVVVDTSETTQEDIDRGILRATIATPLATSLKRCGQEGCAELAGYRFTWLGRDEAHICEQHVEKLRAVADAVGLRLQVISC